MEMYMKKLSLLTVLTSSFLTVIASNPNETIAGLDKSALYQLMDVLDVKHADDLKSIVTATQKAWLRQPGTERWNTPDLYEEKKAELLPLFTQLGLVTARTPQHNKYEAALVLGCANLAAMDKAHFLVQLLKNGLHINSVVILTGERQLTENERDAVATLGISKEELLVEADSMKFIISKTLSDAGFATLPVLVIKCLNTLTADGKITRPTRLDTIHKWIKDLNPAAGNYLALSIQPHCAFEANVIQSAVPAGITVEVAGKEWDVRVAVYLDALARTLYAYYAGLNNALRAQR